MKALMIQSNSIITAPLKMKHRNETSNFPFKHKALKISSVSSQKTISKHHLRYLVKNIDDCNWFWSMAVLWWRKLSNLSHGTGKSNYRCWTDSEQPCDYPDFAYAVASLVSSNKAERGIMIDSVGVASAIVANKVPGVRAVLVTTSLWHAAAASITTPMFLHLRQSFRNWNGEINSQTLVRYSICWRQAFAQSE